MKVLVVEDEIVAAARMREMLKKHPEIEISEVIDSVEEAVNYLSTHTHPDLIFMDIQLADGICFEIFEEVEVDCPVIFTTAYDEYALKAFKVNSIDYLLKPIHPDALANSIHKFKKYNQAHNLEKFDFKTLLSTLQKDSSNYKSRFLVKAAKSYVSIQTSEIAYFYSEDKVSFLMTHHRKKYIIETSLEELYTKLSPDNFFKISRAFIVSHKCVLAIHPYFHNRLKLDLQPGIDKEVFVSRSNVPGFKNWLDL